MSFAPLGIVGSAAGIPLSQTKGTDADRAQQAATDQAGQAQAERLAEAAAGIGSTDGENHETNERDADGRRLWEKRPPPRAQPAAATPAPAEPDRQSRDATGEAGSRLDLTG